MSAREALKLWKVGGSISRIVSECREWELFLEMLGTWATSSETYN